MRYLVILALLLAGCAEAGEDTGNDPSGPDAAPAPLADARPAPIFPDARPVPGTPDAAPLPTPDATPVPTPDATPGGGLFCESNADCTTAGTCCLLALCVPGTAIGDLCLPE